MQDGTVLLEGLQWQQRHRACRGQPFHSTRQAVRDLVPHLQDLDLPHSVRLLRDYVPGDG